MALYGQQEENTLTRLIANALIYKGFEACWVRVLGCFEKSLEAKQAICFVQMPVNTCSDNALLSFQ